MSRWFDHFNNEEHAGKMVTAIEGQTGEGGSRDGLLRITLDDGTVLRGDPMGDCCARTWIDEIAGEVQLPAKLVSIKQTAYVSQDWDWGQKDTFVEVIATSKGDIAVLCRCTHNGYYSGWLDWVVEP